MFPPEVFTIIKTYLSIIDISALVLTCREVNEWVGMNEIIREYYLILPDDESDYESDYLFWDACIEGHINLVMYLSSGGVDPREKNDYAIRMASSSGHLDVVMYLYSIGCDPRACNDYAIRWASGNGHLPVVEFLYSIGCDVRANDDCAIGLAKMYGHTHVVEFLESL
jgi:ankyrin repeat protein